MNEYGCEPLISIIVPVYNAQNYIKNCIDSILEQTYSNLEIILVNDGSTDDSSAICDEYKKKDSRIKVIHKKNGGQASARNLALDCIKGEFIGFVDADDWIDKAMYSTLYNLMIKYDADFATCNFKIVNQKGSERNWSSDMSQERIYTNYELLESLLFNKNINEMFWNKLFKREIFLDERFVEGMIFEDTEMMHRCLSHVKNGVYTGKALYYNFMSEGSATRSNITPKKFDWIKANKNRIEFYKKNYPELVTLANTTYVKIALELINQSTKSIKCKTVRKVTILDLKKFLQNNEIIARKKIFLAKTGSHFGLVVFYFCIRFPYWIGNCRRMFEKK